MPAYPKKYRLPKEKKRIRRVSPKQAKNMRENKKYYARQRERKGLICEECGAPGKEVSHIISGGANCALYLEDENSFILCHKCEQQWTSRGKRSMKIFERSEEIRLRLSHKHYTGDTPA